MIFTAKDALNLADTIRLVEKHAHVIWLADSADEWESPRVGTLRHLTELADSAYHFWGDDVRDAWVRITMESGFDVWEKLTDLATKRGRGELAER